MVLVKVLKRKDATSVIVAIVLAMIVYQLLNAVCARWAGQLAGLDDGQFVNYTSGNDWQSQYLQPVLLAAIEIIVLEVLGWVYVWFSSMMKK
jgi:hypothetical protein